MWKYKDDYTELYHYGILGMKWGVRKNRNADTMSSRQKKRATKKYKKVINMAFKDVGKNDYKRYMKAQSYEVAKVNKEPHTKTKTTAKSIKRFTMKVNTTYNTMLKDEIINNKYYKKADSICKKYDMLKYDKLAQDTNKRIRDLDNLIKEGNKRLGRS